METRSFRKILIANRGEIALRVMRSCHAMGVETVAVYSDADADSPHVRFAGESVHLGAATAQESYLRIDKIVEAARRTGADAIIVDLEDSEVTTSDGGMMIADTMELTGTRPGEPAPMRFIPATGFCPRTPSSQKAARRRASSSSALRPPRFGRWG